MNTESKITRKVRKLKKVNLAFKNDSGKNTFIVYHNIVGKRFDYTIHDVFKVWLSLTQTYALKSFIKYIKFKDKRVRCIPKSQGERLKKLRVIKKLKKISENNRVDYQ